MNKIVRLEDRLDGDSAGDGISSFYGGNGNGTRKNGHTAVATHNATPSVRGKGHLRGGFSIHPVWIVAAVLGAFVLLRR